MNKVAKWLKKYFIPHEENDYKPHFLRHESMTLFFLLIILVELGFLVQVFVVFDKTKFLAAVLPGVLTNLTNEEREQNNLPPLKENDLLTEAAVLKAKDMASRGYFAHTSPEGLTPWYWLEQVGYRYTAAGENLAVNFYESEDVDQAWMNSPTHRANMLKDGFTEIGIGVTSGVYQGRNTVFVAQFFGTPLKITPIAPLPVALADNTPKPAPIAPKTTPAPAQARIAATPTPTQVLGEEKGATPLSATEKTTSNQSRAKTLFEKILTSPLKSANYVYGIMALILLAALILAIFIKSEIQHPAIILRGVTLMAVIIFLFIVNVKVLRPDVAVPTDDLSASIIIAY